MALHCSIYYGMYVGDIILKIKLTYTFHIDLVMNGCLSDIETVYNATSPCNFGIQFFFFQFPGNEDYAVYSCRTSTIGRTSRS